MFVGDSRNWAKVRSDEFNDPRLSYFWDGGKLSGQQWQKVLGTPNTAWDVYLHYSSQKQWGSEPPSPDFWMHQLRGVTTTSMWDGTAFEVKAKELLDQVKR